MNATRLFDIIRRLKGAPLTQAEVDEVNQVLGGGDLRVSPVAIDSIKRWEDCRLTAYPDPGTGGDPWTIGWGSTGPEIVRGVIWTQAQADARFAEDVEKFAGGVRRLLGDAPTSQAQFDALVSLAYNIGLGNLSTSTLLKMHKAGDFKGAAAQFPRWNRAGGKVLNGLTKRRASEARIYQGLPA